MKVKELYSEDLLDVVYTGESFREFDETKGDYIKIEVRDTDFDNVLHTFYSNKLLLQNLDGGYYFGDYHYTSYNGFMEGAEHTDELHNILLPITIGDSLNEPTNPGTQYQKQFNIYRDNDNRVYIKPNEVLEKVDLIETKYKLILYFLRDIKLSLSNMVHTSSTNFIPNGNFFGGRWATSWGKSQSTGYNKIIKLLNPGLGKFVLEQSGLSNNEYDMRIYGIEPNKTYVASCWVAFNMFFDGWKGMFTSGFDSSLGAYMAGGSSDVSGWVAETVQIGDLIWEHRYLVLSANANADRGTGRWYVGYQNGEEGERPENEDSRRYFTDLRFEKLQGSSIEDIIIRTDGQEWSDYPEEDKQPANQQLIPNPNNIIVPPYVPLYRFWNESIGDHLYTANQSEKESIEAVGEWAFEGTECYILKKLSPSEIQDLNFNGGGIIEPSLRPLYRFWNGSTGNHFYTTVAQGDWLDDQAVEDYTYQNVTGYVSNTPTNFIDSPTNYVDYSGELIPLHRFVHGEIGDYFYTTLGPDEWDPPPSEIGYTYEDITAVDPMYVIPVGEGGTSGMTTNPVTGSEAPPGPGF